MSSLRHAHLGVAAGLAFVPAALLGASEAGQMLAQGDFLQLQSLGLPAAGVLILAGLVVLLSSRLGPARRRVLGSVLALAGAMLAFEGARVLSTYWLLWGRGLLIEPGLLTYTAGALLWIVAGTLALIEGSRSLEAGPDPGRGMVLVAGLGLASVPALPWVLLTGPGEAATLLFNDLTDAIFSQFPLQGPIRWAMWTIAGGLAWTTLAAAWTRPWIGQRPWRRRLVVGLGPLAVVGAHAVFVVEALGLREALRGGQLYPGFNVLPLLATLVVAWQLWRSTPGSADDQAPEAASDGQAVTFRQDLSAGDRA